MSKSSMIAPPAWLKRLTPTRWPTSRNLPMSNSDLRKRSSEIRIPRIDLVGIFAQGHVGQVEQPADLEVVGELLEVLGEVLDRQAGAVGLGVDGGRGDRKDARALAAAHDAVVVLAAAQGGHALEVDDRVEPLLRQVLLGSRPATEPPGGSRSSAAIPLAGEQPGFVDGSVDDPGDITALPCVLQAGIDGGNQPQGGSCPQFGDRLQRSVILPGRDRGQE